MGTAEEAVVGAGTAAAAVAPAAVVVATVAAVVVVATAAVVVATAAVAARSATNAPPTDDTSRTARTLCTSAGGFFVAYERANRGKFRWLCGRRRGDSFFGW